MRRRVCWSVGEAAVTVVWGGGGGSDDGDRRGGGGGGRRHHNDAVVAVVSNDTFVIPVHLSQTQYSIIVNTRNNRSFCRHVEYVMS